MTELLVIRPATLDDARPLFDWRNDPVTRDASRQTEEITWEGHVAWLSATLKREDRKIYIAEQYHLPVGTVRIDRHGDDYELSWTVNPRARGRGIGKEMVARVADWYTATLVAEIRPNNPSSIAIAKHAGMQQVPSPSEEFLLFKRPAENTQSGH